MLKNQFKKISVRSIYIVESCYKTCYTYDCSTSERYNQLMHQMTAALAEARKNAEKAEDKAREKMEAVLDKAEKRHEAEISRLLAQIELITKKEDKERKEKNASSSNLNTSDKSQIS